MKRALGWTVVGFAVLILGIFAALWVGTRSYPADSPSAVATAPDPTTPVPPLAPPLAVPLQPAPAPSGAGEVGSALAPAPSSAGEAGPASALPGPAAATGAPHGEDAMAAFRAAQREESARIRSQAKERARARHEESLARHAALHEAHERWAATRAPDPNRPAFPRERLKLGPGIISARGEPQE